MKNVNREMMRELHHIKSYQREQKIRSLTHISILPKKARARAKKDLLGAQQTMDEQRQNPRC